RDRGGVDGVGDLHAVVEDRLHELAVVRHHRALAGREAQRLRPAETETHRQGADLRVLVHAARVAGDVQAGDAERAAGARDVHERVQDGRRGLLRVLAVAAGLEAHRGPAPVDPRETEDRGDAVAWARLRDVDRLAAER